MNSAVPSAVLQLFAARPASVQQLALCARQMLLHALPGAMEFPDEKASLVGYGYGTGYKDMVATLILSQAGVKIGLVGGASLTDPASLLEGQGKVHRHIALRTEQQLRRPEVEELLEAASSAWQERSITTRNACR